MMARRAKSANEDNSQKKSSSFNSIYFEVRKFTAAHARTDQVNSELCTLQDDIAS